MSAARRILRWGLLCLFFLCLLLSLDAASKVEDTPDLRTLIQDGVSIDAKAAKAMAEREEKEEQPAEFAVWGQESGKNAENPDLGRSATLDVLMLHGNSRLLLPSGAALLPDDREGCLIDRETGQKLFGSASPVGSVLTYEGTELTVRGVLESGGPLLLVQAQSGVPGTMGRVTLRMQEGVSPQKLMTEFGNRHALEGSWVQLRAYRGLAQAASSLAPAVMLLWALFSLLKTTFSTTSYPIPFLLCLTVSAAFYFLLLWVTGFSLSFSEEFIPSKWSDFDFWGRLWETKKAELLLLVTSRKLAPELNVLMPALQACGFGLCALLLFFPTLRRIKIPNERALWGYLGASFLLAFLGVVVLDNHSLAASRLLWLSPGLFLCFSYFGPRLRQWTKGIDEPPPVEPKPEKHPRPANGTTYRARRFRA